MLRLTRHTIIFTMRNLCFLLLLTVLACAKEDCAPQVPPCLLDRLLDESPVPIVEVQRWDIDDDHYFYLVADCCDIPSALFDEDCNFICSPDGGLTGRGDGNCPDFPESFDRTVIWKKQQ